MPEDTAQPAANPAEGFQNILAKHNNDATALAARLWDDNFQLRETNRQLKEAAPKEGSVVLSADDAKAWQAYKDLGIEPKELKKAIERLPQLEKENKELAGMETLRELADVGLDGSKLKLSVLKDQLAKYPDAVIRFDTQKSKDGTESKVAFIKTGDKESPFADFAAEKLSDYIPALKVSPAENDKPITPGNTHDPRPQGGATSIFDRIREKVATQEKAKAAPADIDARFGKPASV